MDNELKWTTHKTNQVFLDEGWYTKEYLQIILDALNKQDEHIKKSIGKE